MVALFAALVVIAVFVMFVARLGTRQTGPLRVVLTGYGVAADGRTPVATFVLTNRTTRGYIAFGKNDPNALYLPIPRHLGGWSDELD